MQPNHLVRVKPKIHSANNLTGEMFSSPVLTGRLLGVLHQASCRERIPFAIALPWWVDIHINHKESVAEWGELQFFCGTHEEVERLASCVAAHFLFRDYTDIGEPFDVTQKAEQHIEYRRRRLRNKKSIHYDESKHWVLEEQKKDILKNRFPLLEMPSRSTGAMAKMTVQPQVFDSCEMPASCEPNAHGLSVASRPFAVPHIAAE